MNFDFVQLIITSRRDEDRSSSSRVRVSNVREREVADDAVRVGAPLEAMRTMRTMGREAMMRASDDGAMMVLVRSRRLRSMKIKCCF